MCAHVQRTQQFAALSLGWVPAVLSRPVDRTPCLTSCCVVLAVLQASQPDEEEAPDNILGSPEFCPQGVLFGSPLSGASEDQAGAAAAATAAAAAGSGGGTGVGAAAAGGMVLFSQGPAAGAAGAAAPDGEVTGSRQPVSTTVTAP